MNWCFRRHPDQSRKCSTRCFAGHRRWASRRRSSGTLNGAWPERSFFSALPDRPDCAHAALNAQTDLRCARAPLQLPLPSPYRHAIQEANLSPEVDMSISDYRSAEFAVRAHINGCNPPDAIFALKDFATIYVCEALQNMNIKVPPNDSSDRVRRF